MHSHMVGPPKLYCNAVSILGIRNAIRNVKNARDYRYTYTCNIMIVVISMLIII